METETPTPTVTATPTVTPTATPEIWIEVTTEAGYAARIGREVTIGDYSITFLLILILVSIWVMFIVNRLKGGK